MTNDEKTALFWELAQPFIDNGAERSTMMGFPCVRTEAGEFFGSIHKDTRDLVIKLPAGRVSELVECGTAESFAPSGRVFKEWASIPEPDRDVWQTLLAEAFDFVSGAD